MVINQVNKKLSLGIDGINYLIISKLPMLAREILLDLYNKFSRMQSYPVEWKEFLVFFILKDETKRKYRPISLSMCLGKIMKKMVNNKLNW